MKTITKWNKNTGEKSLVSVEEFLEFVGSGKKRREEAFISLIQGGLYQNIEIAYFISPLRNTDEQEQAKNDDLTALVIKLKEKVDCYHSALEAISNRKYTCDDYRDYCGAEFIANEALENATKD